MGGLRRDQSRMEADRDTAVVSRRACSLTADARSAHFGNDQAAQSRGLTRVGGQGVVPCPGGCGSCAWPLQAGITTRRRAAGADRDSSCQLGSRTCRLGGRARWLGSPRENAAAIPAASEPVPSAPSPTSHPGSGTGRRQVASDEEVEDRTQVRLLELLVGSSSNRMSSCCDRLPAFPYVHPRSSRSSQPPGRRRRSARMTARPSVIQFFAPSRKIKSSTGSTAPEASRCFSISVLRNHACVGRWRRACSSRADPPSRGPRAATGRCVASAAIQRWSDGRSRWPECCGDEDSGSSSRRAELQQGLWSVPDDVLVERASTLPVRVGKSNPYTIWAASGNSTRVPSDTERLRRQVVQPRSPKLLSSEDTARRQ